MFLFQTTSKAPTMTETYLSAPLPYACDLYKGKLQAIHDEISFNPNAVHTAKLDALVADLRKLVSLSKPLSAMISGNNGLKEKWEQLNLEYENVRKWSLPGAAYSANTLVLNDAVFNALSAMKAIQPDIAARIPKNAFATENGPTSAFASNSNPRLGAAYENVMDNLERMFSAIENNRPDIAISYGNELFKSNAYKEVLRKSPEFREQFENAMYGLRVASVSSPEYASVLKRLQTAFLSANREKIDNHLVSMPDGLNGTIMQVVLSDAYNSLRQIQFSMIKAAYLEQLNEAMVRKDMPSANAILDYLSLASDVHYNIMRHEPVAAKAQKDKLFGVPEIKKDNLPNSPPEIAFGKKDNLGITHLPNTAEGRFLEGSDLDKINKAVLSGNTGLAQSLVNGTLNRILDNKALAAISPALRNKDEKQYIKDHQLAMIFDPSSSPTLLTLLPLYTAGTEAAEVYKSCKEGNVSAIIYHSAAGLGYLALDLAAIYSGGLSKGAGLLLTKARTIERFASLSRGSEQVAKSLDELSGLLKTLNTAGEINPGELARLEKNIVELQKASSRLANKGTNTLNSVKKITWKGGLKEVQLGTTLPKKAKIPVKLNSELDPVLKEINGKANTMPMQPAPGASDVVLTPGIFDNDIQRVDWLKNDYQWAANNLNKTSVRLGYNMKAPSIAGKYNDWKNYRAGKANPQSLELLSPIATSKTPKKFGQYVGELDDAARNSINGLKDGEVFDLTVNGIGTRGRFKVVKIGDETRVYRASEYDDMFKAAKSDPPASVGKAESKGGSAWGKKLDEPVPICRAGDADYDSILSYLSAGKKQQVGALSDGERVNFTVKLPSGTEAYTFVNHGGTIEVYSQSVYSKYLKDTKRAIKNAKASISSKVDATVEAAGKAKGTSQSLLSSVPQKTFQAFFYKPVEWKGLKPSRTVESLGVVPAKINEASSWVRNSNAFSISTIKSEFGSIPLKEVERASLHGKFARGMSWAPAYTLGYTLGTASALGRGITYPLQAGAHLTSGLVGTGALVAELGTGLVFKTADVGINTLLRQNLKFMGLKYGVRGLQQNFLSPDDMKLKTKGLRSITPTVEKNPSNTGEINQETPNNNTAVKKTEKPSL